MQNHNDQHFQEADFDNQAQVYDGVDEFEDERDHKYQQIKQEQQQQQQQQQIKKPKLTEEEQRYHDIVKYGENIFYSQPYNDDEFEFRHVYLPKPLLRYFQPDHLMSEREWRSLGVRQSVGWEHYMIHAPEPHVLLFRREKDYREKYLKKAEVPVSEVPVSESPENP